MGWTGPRRRGDTQPERAQTSAMVSTVEKPWNAWNCRRCWMVQTELTGEQRQTATWSEIDWTATEAVVKRLQGRIYRAAAAGNGRQVKNLQKLLVRSTSAKRTFPAALTTSGMTRCLPNCRRSPPPSVAGSRPAWWNWARGYNNGRHAARRNRFARVGQCRPRRHGTALRSRRRPG